MQERQHLDGRKVQRDRVGRMWKGEFRKRKNEHVEEKQAMMGGEKASAGIPYLVPIPEAHAGDLVRQAS